ncbi:hypothetical protein ACNKHN_00335 [Shigella flexneri]
MKFSSHSKLVFSKPAGPSVRRKIHPYGTALRLRYRAQDFPANSSVPRQRPARSAHQLIPHQLNIAHDVSRRHAPRVLLADEAGLGKTIEAGMILHQQLLSALLTCADYRPGNLTASSGR